VLSFALICVVCVEMTKYVRFVSDDGQHYVDVPEYFAISAGINNPAFGDLLYEYKAAKGPPYIRLDRNIDHIVIDPRNNGSMLFEANGSPYKGRKVQFFVVRPVRSSRNRRRRSSPSSDRGKQGSIRLHQSIAEPNCLQDQMRRARR
jgi:hypothetical protein